MNWIDIIRKACRTHVVRIIGWVFFGAGLITFAGLLLIIIHGEAWDKVFYITHPRSHVIGSALLFFLSFIILKGVHLDRRGWLVVAGRMVLIGFGVLFACGAGEILLRVSLHTRQERESISHLKAFKEGKRKIPIMSSQPLAFIVHPSKDPRLVYELDPDLKMDFGHHWLEINHEEMRSPRHYTIEHPSNVVRIVGIGDSGMFGWNVDEGQEYLSVLEKNLNKRNDGWIYETLNLAVPGYDTRQEEEMLSYHGLQYHPDIVIIGWCDNDFDLPFFIPQQSLWKRKDLSYLYMFLFDRDRYNNLTRGTLHDLMAFESNSLPDRITAMAGEDAVEKAFTEILNMGKQDGFHVLVFGPICQQAIHICQRTGMPYFNTRERIPMDAYPPEYCVHFMHPHPGGHRVLAEYLEKELESRHWLAHQPRK